MYSNNQEIEYSKLTDPLTSFSDDSKVGANAEFSRTVKCCYFHGSFNIVFLFE